MKYDFCGWASKNDLKCSDGVIIKRGAFKSSDKKKVPMFWNHRHETPSTILGHSVLENRDEGVYAYCCFNGTTAAKDAKEAVMHGDVESLSILANHIQRNGYDVIEGNILEVSLVPAGANPGAFVESVISHGEPLGDFEDECFLYTGEGLILEHADEGGEEDDEEEPTVKDILNTLTDQQKAAVGILISEISEDNEDNEDNEDEEGEVVRHNVFHGKQGEGSKKYVSQEDISKIFADAKSCGSLRESIRQHMTNGVLVHAELPTTGFDVPSATPAPSYGINGIDMLFPDHKSLTPTPEFIGRNMDWVDKVINSVHRSPFSRVKSIFANITEDEARAKGYIKGKLKKEEVFSILKRVTDPKTVYKKQKLDRDDVLDIGDNLNVVQWLRAEMLMMLKEEIARAILIGDGRLASSDDKISEANIRPIMNEHDLLSVKIPVKVSATATEDEIAAATIKTMIKSRKQYKGKGSPSWYTTDDVVTDMLLLENAIGDQKYKTENELATTLRVKEIIPVEPMENTKITISGSQYPVLGIVVNLIDYNVGRDRGGEISWFDDFDIDYNQYIYLGETRMSGALIRPYSALVYYLDKAPAVPPES